MNQAHQKLRDTYGIEPNWTYDEDGCSNASPAFLRLCNEVERLIRSDAHTLIAGRADSTARLIVAQLAHVHGLAPTKELV